MASEACVESQSLTVVNSFLLEPNTCKFYSNIYEKENSYLTQVCRRKPSPSPVRKHRPVGWFDDSARDENQESGTLGTMVTSRAIERAEKFKFDDSADIVKTKTRSSYCKHCGIMAFKDTVNTVVCKVDPGLDSKAKMYKRFKTWPAQFGDLFHFHLSKRHSHAVPGIDYRCPKMYLNHVKHLSTKVGIHAGADSGFNVSNILCKMASMKYKLKHRRIRNPTSPFCKFNSKAILQLSKNMLMPMCQDVANISHLYYRFLHRFTSDCCHYLPQVTEEGSHESPNVGVVQVPEAYIQTEIVEDHSKVKNSFCNDVIEAVEEDNIIIEPVQDYLNDDTERNICCQLLSDLSPSYLYADLNDLPQINEHLRKALELCCRSRSEGMLIKMFSPVLTGETNKKDLIKPLFSVESTSINMLCLKSLDYGISDEEVMVLKSVDPAFTKGWVYDNVIDAFFSRIMKPESTFLCSAVGQLILSVPVTFAPITNNLQTIFIPYNINGCHWILIDINPRTREICIYDPSTSMLSLKDESRCLIKNLLRNLGDTDPFQDLSWIITYPSHCKQKDDYNCGVFICWFCERLVLKLNLLEEFDPISFREKIFLTIINGYPINNWLENPNSR